MRQIKYNAIRAREKATIYSEIASDDVWIMPDSSFDDICNEVYKAITSAAEDGYCKLNIHVIKKDTFLKKYQHDINSIGTMIKKELEKMGYKVRLEHNELFDLNDLWIEISW